MKKPERINKKTKQNKTKQKTLIDADNSIMITRGGGEVEEGTGGINGDGRRLDLGGGGEHTI